MLQWHLTGIELESEEDPASEEHFGISVAEGELSCTAAAGSAGPAAAQPTAVLRVSHAQSMLCACLLCACLLRRQAARSSVQPHPRCCLAAGMSSGVIPVVLNRGGVGDIVKHGHNGFLAPTAQVGAVGCRLQVAFGQACSSCVT